MNVEESKFIDIHVMYGGLGRTGSMNEPPPSKLAPPSGSLRDELHSRGHKLYQYYGPIFLAQLWCKIHQVYLKMIVGSISASVLHPICAVAAGCVVAPGNVRYLLYERLVRKSV